jgi:hypothetical protein
VLSRVAALDTRDPLIVTCRGERRRQVMIVRSRAVMVVGMIVIRVGVRMQQRPHARGHQQRRNEEERQDARHAMSL